MKENIIIHVGSTNRVKVNAVSTIFKNATVYGVKTDSKVSSQPMSDLETKTGAKNRALFARSIDTFGLGLEGGVMKIKNRLFLCNWGAFATPEGKVFVASGARIPLPNFVEPLLLKGRELGDIMDELEEEKDVRQNAGAIGVFTNHLVCRQEMFEHVVQLLYGQFLFEPNKKQ